MRSLKTLTLICVILFETLLFAQETGKQVNFYFTQDTAEWCY